MVRPLSACLSILCAIVALAPGMPAHAAPVYTTVVERYEVPDITLIDQNGKPVRLRNALLGDRPVMVDFVYTTCTTICPVLSANFTNFQSKLGPDTAAVRFVSISIDPENDRPKAMKEYLRRFHAKPGWDYLTGSRHDIDQVLKALNAYAENKMNHSPLILLRGKPGGQWVRILGLIGTSDLMKEFEKATR